MKTSINWRAICYVNGFLTLGLAFSMMIPPLFDAILFKTGETAGFYIGFLLCFVVGGTVVLGNRTKQKMTLGMKEAFLITTLVWIVLSFFSAIPFYLTVKDIAFIDACFESVSALTTTGTTVFRKVESLPETILLWRAFLQWFGGIGIIVIAMSFFPALRLGGMQLFRSEFSDRYEKILPRISQISTSLLGCYAAFTVLCAILFVALGMSGFDAICHAMCTISTGGLSNYSNSLAHFNSLAIEIVASIFMIIGGITLMLFIRIFYGDWSVLFKDTQFKAFLKAIFVASIIVVFWLWYVENLDFLYSLRYGTFNVISSITTTGYSSIDTSPWQPFSHMIFFLLGCIGGCTGSTTGGVKIFRIQVLSSIAYNHMCQLTRPHSVLFPKFQDQKITDAAAFSVFTMMSLYILSLVILATLLCACGFDFLNALSAAGSVLGNVGTTVVPMLAKKILAPEAKTVLMIGMICGRLELLTVLILFMPSFWQE